MCVWCCVWTAARTNLRSNKWHKVYRWKNSSSWKKLVLKIGQCGMWIHRFILSLIRIRFGNIVHSITFSENKFYCFCVSLKDLYVCTNQNKPILGKSEKETVDTQWFWVIPTLKLNCQILLGPLQIVFTCKIPKLQGVQTQKLVHFSSKNELYT